MSETEDSKDGFRAKFVDIRIKPPGHRGRKNVRNKQPVSDKVCEHKGCDKPGDCKAPKQTAAALKRKRKRDEDFHWFCQRHASEFNKTYNFFDGMTESEYLSFRNSEDAGHQKTWKFGTGPVGGTSAAEALRARRYNGRHEFDGAGNPIRPSSAKDKPERTRLQVKALEELGLPHNADAKHIKVTYSRIIKECHPDSNGGDRSQEHRLAQVMRAFKTLKAAGLT